MFFLIFSVKRLSKICKNKSWNLIYTIVLLVNLGLNSLSLMSYCCNAELFLKIICNYYVQFDLLHAFYRLNFWSFMEIIFLIFWTEFLVPYFKIVLGQRGKLSSSCLMYLCLSFMYYYTWVKLSCCNIFSCALIFSVCKGVIN